MKWFINHLWYHNIYDWYIDMMYDSKISIFCKLDINIYVVLIEVSVCKSIINMQLVDPIKSSYYFNIILKYSI